MTTQPRHLTGLPTATALVDRSELLAGLDRVCRVIERRNTIPILNHVRLYGGAGGLTVAGTDMDVDAVVSVPGAADPDLNVCLPGHALLNALKKAKRGEFVEIRDTRAGADNRVTVEIDALRLSIESLPASEFPKMRTNTFGDGAVTFDLPAATFARMLQVTAAVMSTEEARYYLNGVYMHRTHDGKLRLVATDGHRLASHETEAPDGYPEGVPGVIIPAKTVHEVLRLVGAKGAPERVSISLGNSGPDEEGKTPDVRQFCSRVAFWCGYTVITSKLVDGTFPDYQRVVPSAWSRTARVDKAELVAAVDQVTAVASERGLAVKAAFHGADATLSVQNPELGTASMVVPLGEDVGEPITIGFNATYLRGLLQSFATGILCIHMNDAGSPARLEAGDPYPDPADYGYRAVLMPLRV